MRIKRFFYRSYYRSAGFKFRLRRLFTPAGWLVFFTFLICGGIGVDTNQAMAYQAFALLGAVLAIAALWQFWPVPRLETQRELPRYATVGCPIFYRLRIRNPFNKTFRGLMFLEGCGDPRPGLTEFLQTPEPAENRRNAFDRALGYYRWNWLTERNRRARVAEAALPVLPPQSETEISLELLPLRRGPLRFEGAALAGTDPFGLARRVRPVAAVGSMLVLPKRYLIPPIALPGTLEYQPGGVALASSVGESEEFISLREYRRGDPLRHVHWKSSARTGELVVKEFQDEYFVRHAMVLDTFQTSQPPEVFEEAVAVAASFACTMQNQDSLLDLLFAGPQAYCFTCGRGVGQTEHLLEILASVEPSRETPFQTLENLVLEHLPQVSGAICIFLAWDKQRQELIRKMNCSGIPVMVLLVVNSGHTQEIDPGPMRESPGSFRVLEAGKIEEGLSRC